MSKPMLRRTLILTSFLVLAACGPSQQPQDQNGQAPANPPPAAPAANTAPAAAAPSAADEEAAKVAAEKRKLAALKRQEAELQQQQQAQAAPAPAPAPAPVCQDCGVITAITPVTQEGQAGVAGTLGGAAVGGLAGNQFGKGKGKTAMTVLGVIGGALAGREVEKKVTSKTVYQISVNMDAGGTRTVTVADASGLAVGTKVHVNGNSVQPY
ncbi:MAG: glycine zipper 2TM domain-containing protein [Nevskia sp.]|nr:glycine zipper 2TM domain-containing protein [Nevskia sp.]